MKIIRHNVGDKVIALSNPPTPTSQFRVKGKTYTVQAIMYCIGCGKQLINIGLTCDFAYFTRCGSCNNRQPANGLYWTDSAQFVKPEDIQETISEAVEEENYELAQLLSEIEL